MQSKVYPTYKTKYRVANWPAYNRALVRRGDESDDRPRPTSVVSHRQVGILSVGLMRARDGTSKHTVFVG